MQPTYATLSSSGSTRWFPADWWRNPISPLGVSVISSGGAAWTLDVTLDDPSGQFPNPLLNPGAPSGAGPGTIGGKQERHRVQFQPNLRQLAVRRLKRRRHGAGVRHHSTDRRVALDVEQQLTRSGRCDHAARRTKVITGAILTIVGLPLGFFGATRFNYSIMFSGWAMAAAGVVVFLS